MTHLHVDLNGKVALVTGGSRGIGRAIAVALGRCGASVCVGFHKNAGAAEETVSNIKAIGADAWAVQADVTQKAEVDRLFARLRDRTGDRLDVLVNNAGGPGRLAPIAEMSEDFWDRSLALNLKSVFLCTQAALPLLPDDSGRIINVTSISARTGAGPGGSHYAAAKAGVSSFTRTTAKELAPRRITVNAVAPGVIDTDLHRELTSAEQLEELKKRIPLAEIGKPEDVAGAVLFLCSNQARYITGEIIEINGGMLMN